MMGGRRTRGNNARQPSRTAQPAGPVRRRQPLTAIQARLTAQINAGTALEAQARVIVDEIGRARNHPNPTPHTMTFPSQPFLAERATRLTELRDRYDTWDRDNKAALEELFTGAGEREIYTRNRGLVFGSLGPSGLTADTVTAEVEEFITKVSMRVGRLRESVDRASRMEGSDAPLDSGASTHNTEPTSEGSP